MKKELEDRLKVVYATGKLRHHAEDSLYGFEYREMIHNALCLYLPTTGVIANKQPLYEGQIVFSWAINLSMFPSFGEWTSFEYDKMIKWFEDNNRSYPVLWIHCSRVWPSYYWYYNIWSKPNPIGSDIIKCVYEPYDLGWLQVHNEIENIMKSLQIEYLSKEELHEIVPFVLNEMWLDKDNGSSCADLDDDDEGLPYLDETAVVQCLFQNE